MACYIALNHIPYSLGEINLRNGQNDHILRKPTEPFLCNILILHKNYLYGFVA